MGTSVSEYGSIVPCGGRTRQPWFWGMFHAGAFYVSAVGMLAVISGQLDLLLKNMQGEGVNIWARCLEFIHWFFLIFMGIGVWMLGGVSISWFLLKVLLMVVIGWQIAVGIVAQWRPTYNQAVAGMIATVVSIALGTAACIVRVQDPSAFGWGWMLEASTAILATCIVASWIYADISTMKVNVNAYPRSFFLKGIASNLLKVWFLAHVLVLSFARMGNFSTTLWLEIGLTFNVVVGNLLYFGYYFAYEYYRRQQEQSSAIKFSAAE